MAGAGLAVLGIGVAIVALATESLPAITANRMITLVFCLMTVGIASRDVLLSGEINLNRIIGAICVYLLLGVIWAILYSFVETTWTGSFSGLDTNLGIAPAHQFLYFSFVTLTTLGYGDISPSGPVSGALAYLQAIFGQMYIAVLIAGLVGAWVAKATRD